MNASSLRIRLQISFATVLALLLPRCCAPESGCCSSGNVNQKSVPACPHCVKQTQTSCCSTNAQELPQKCCGFCGCFTESQAVLTIRSNPETWRSGYLTAFATTIVASVDNGHDAVVRHREYHSRGSPTSINQRLATLCVWGI